MTLIDGLNHKLEESRLAAKQVAQNSLYVDAQGELQVLIPLAMIDGVIAMDNTCQVGAVTRVFECYIEYILKRLNKVYANQPEAKHYLPQLARLKREYTELKATKGSHGGLHSLLCGLVGADSNATVIQLAPKKQHDYSSFARRRQANCFSLNKSEDKQNTLAAKLRNLVGDPETLRLYLEKMRARSQQSSFSIEHWENKCVERLNQAMDSQHNFSLADAILLVERELIRRLNQLQSCRVTRQDVDPESICMAWDSQASDLLKASLGDDFRLKDIFIAVWSTMQVTVSDDDPMIRCLTVNQVRRGGGQGQTQLINDMNDNVFSITVQFFLAMINIYCCEHGLSGENFGKAIEAQSDMQAELIGDIRIALAEGQPLQMVCIRFINRHYVAFGLHALLTDEQQQGAVNLFDANTHVLTSDSSDRFYDEFLFLLRRPGIFVNYRGRLNTTLQTVNAAVDSNRAGPYRFAHWQISSTAQTQLPGLDELLNEDFELDQNLVELCDLLNLIENRYTLGQAVEPKFFEMYRKKFVARDVYFHLSSVYLSRNRRALLAFLVAILDKAPECLAATFEGKQLNDFLAVVTSVIDSVAKPLQIEYVEGLFAGLIRSRHNLWSSDQEKAELQLFLEDIREKAVPRQEGAELPRDPVIYLGPLLLHQNLRARRPVAPQPLDLGMYVGQLFPHQNLRARRPVALQPLDPLWYDLQLAIAEFRDVIGYPGLRNGDVLMRCLWNFGVLFRMCYAFIKIQLSQASTYIQRSTLYQYAGQHFVPMACLLIPVLQNYYSTVPFSPLEWLVFMAPLLGNFYDGLRNIRECFHAYMRRQTAGLFMPVLPEQQALVQEPLFPQLR